MSHPRQWQKKGRCLVVLQVLPKVHILALPLVLDLLLVLFLDLLLVLSRLQIHFLQSPRMPCIP